MAQSKTIKNQATTAKRAATSITSLVELLDWENTNTQSKGITRAEHDVLIKAVSILNKIGSTRSTLANQVKSDEIAKEKAIKKAELEARQIISNWEAPITTLDKISLIIAGSEDYSLNRYIVDGLPIWNRETTTDDWLNLLNEMVRDVIKEVPAYAAYRAVTNKKSIIEVMATEKEKLITIKTSTKAKMLAKAYEAKINP